MNGFKRYPDSIKKETELKKSASFSQNNIPIVGIMIEHFLSSHLAERLFWKDSLCLGGQFLLLLP